MSLSVAATPWFRVERIDHELARIDEPHVHDFLRANVWHLRGRDHDLLVDTGLGVAPLRPVIRTLTHREPIVFVSHAHLDHIGGAHEFHDIRMHARETDHTPVAASLRGPVLASLLGMDAAELPAVLLDAVPDPGFALDDYVIHASPATTGLRGGDAIDLGDRVFEVLHLPGHTPGSSCLYEWATGILFSGDVVYDDELLDTLRESNVADYVASMRRLAELSVSVVYPGHGEPFSGVRLRELAEEYISSHRAGLE
jgi:glyoxylase-like metal-dependent hydrolase (beta-lactamase superfamily II)